MRNRIISVLVTIALATSAWGAVTLVDILGRLNRVEADGTTLFKWLERIEQKLDRALENR